MCRYPIIAYTLLLLVLYIFIIIITANACFFRPRTAHGHSEHPADQAQTAVPPAAHQRRRFDSAAGPADSWAPAQPPLRRHQGQHSCYLLFTIIVIIVIIVIIIFTSFTIIIIVIIVIITTIVVVSGWE